MRILKSTLQMTVIMGITAIGSSCQLLAQSAPFAAGQVVGTIKDSRLNEISGIVASRTQDVLWVHNDSGDAPQVFAINFHGQVLGVYLLAGVPARDWEDIAVGPGPDPNQNYLYIGDIGDNRAIYPEITILRVPEPHVSTSPFQSPQRLTQWESLRLTYPDGARDAESLFVDPMSGDIYIITKRDLFSRVYRAAAPLSPSKVTTLNRVTLLPWGLATGADISPDGQYIVVRSPYQGMLWTRPTNQVLWKTLHLPGKQITLLPERQGEAICFDRHGKGLYSLSEGHQSTLHFYAWNGDRDKQSQPTSE